MAIVLPQLQGFESKPAGQAAEPNRSQMPQINWESQEQFEEASSGGDSNSGISWADPFAAASQQLLETYFSQNPEALRDTVETDSGTSGLRSDFNRWFQDQGMQVKNAFYGGHRLWGTFDREGNQIGGIRAVSTNEGLGWDLAVALLGGVVGNVAGAGMGLGSAGAGALGGASSAAISTAGDPQAIAQGAVSGGLGSALDKFNLGGRLGLSGLSSAAVNAGARGALSAGVRGENIGAGALSGAVGGSVRNLGVGLFGGDAFGKTLASVLANVSAGSVRGRLNKQK